jgi:hypothetical protein
MTRASKAGVAGWGFLAGVIVGAVSIEQLGSLFSAHAGKSGWSSIDLGLPFIVALAGSAYIPMLAVRVAVLGCEPRRSWAHVAAGVGCSVAVAAAEVLGAVDVLGLVLLVGVPMLPMITTRPRGAVGV